MGLVALAVIAVAIPKRSPRQEHAVDYLGAALLAAGTTSLLLGLVWGGQQYPWGSVEVVGALISAAVFLAAFAFVERRAPEPILPYDLLRKRTVAAGVVAIGLSAMAMIGTVAYVPLFVQGVIGTSATSSGAVLTPLFLGAVTASALSGLWISRSGHYRPNALAGPVVLGVGLFLLSRMNPSTTNLEAARNMVIAGVGLGLMMQVFVIAVQNVVPHRQMGSATALTQFARSIGATLGVTLMGVIVNQRLPKDARIHRQSIHRLPLDLRNGLAHALQPAFLAAAVLCLVTLAIVFLWLDEVPLGRSSTTCHARPRPRPPSPRS